MSTDSEGVAPTPLTGRGAAIEDHPDTLTMGVLSRKWGMVLFWDIATGSNVTFTALLRAHPGLSPRILTMRLTELLEEDLVLRGPPTAETARPAYAITRKGLDALTILQAVLEFTARYSEGTELTRSGPPGEAAETGSDAGSRSLAEPVGESPRCGRCERPLGAGEAVACSHGCTWCPDCADASGHACPNCGEVLRPVPIPSARTAPRRNVGGSPVA